MSPLEKLRLIQAVTRAKELTAVQARLLTDLIVYCGGKCQAWPSVETLAAHVGITKRAARVNLAAIVEFGLVSREIRPGRTHSNIYTIRAEVVMSLHEEKRNGGSPFRDPKEERRRTEKRNVEVPKRGTGVPPNKFIESVHRISGGEEESGSRVKPPSPEQTAATTNSNSEKKKNGEELELIRGALRELNFDKPPDAKLIRRLRDDGHKLGANPGEVAAFISTFSGRRRVGFGLIVVAMNDDFGEWLTEHRQERANEERQRAEANRRCRHGARVGTGEWCQECCDEVEDQRRAVALAAKKCQTCFDSGLVDADVVNGSATSYERCSCEAAAGVSDERLERLNAGLKKLRGLSEKPATGGGLVAVGDAVRAIQ